MFWDTGGNFPTPKVATLPGRDPNISGASSPVSEFGVYQGTGQRQQKRVFKEEQPVTTAQSLGMQLFSAGLMDVGGATTDITHLSATDSQNQHCHHTLREDQPPLQTGFMV